MVESLPRIIVTTGEPAGIGPDIVLKAAVADDPHDRFHNRFHHRHRRPRYAGKARAEILGVKVKVVDDDLPHRPHQPDEPGVLSVIHQPCKTTAVAGVS